MDLAPELNVYDLIPLVDRRRDCMICIGSTGAVKVLPWYFRDIVFIIFPPRLHNWRIVIIIIIITITIVHRNYAIIIINIYYFFIVVRTLRTDKYD